METILENKLKNMMQEISRIDKERERLFSEKTAYIEKVAQAIQEWVNAGNLIGKIINLDFDGNDTFVKINEIKECCFSDDYIEPICIVNFIGTYQCLAENHKLLGGIEFFRIYHEYPSKSGRLMLTADAETGEIIVSDNYDAFHFVSDMSKYEKFQNEVKSRKAICDADGKCLNPGNSVKLNNGEIMIAIDYNKEKKEFLVTDKNYNNDTQQWVKQSEIHLYNK